VLIAIAGWRCWERAPSAAPMRIWGAQLVLNFLWSPIFFGAHFMGLALVVILALLASILVFMLASSRHDKIAAWLFAPYAVWVAFAALLNGSLWWLN
jgi:tryptophan-rich sensory protein